MRNIELILTHNGGAELVDIDVADGITIWASDSDDDFKEEFPEFLVENDVEHVLDYLVDKGLIDDDEADEAEISIESVNAEATAGPGDENDEDDED